MQWYSYTQQIKNIHGSWSKALSLTSTCGFLAVFVDFNFDSSLLFVVEIFS